MSSLEGGAGITRENGPGVFRLLDAMLGLIVWACHFLIVYIGAAMVCVASAGAVSEGTGRVLRIVLALITLGIAALVALHGFVRYREQRGVPDQRFRMAVTVGCDAIAIVAILWQLFSIWLVPVCA
jgi:hypothetical protein